jgi:hypothetical protein
MILANPGWAAGAKPDRSGEPLLLEVLHDLRSVRAWHVRIYRETRESNEGVYLADRVTEVWLDGSGSVRIEMVDFWGDGGLWLRDKHRSVVDRLGSLREADVLTSRGGWREPDVLKSFAGDSASPFFDLIVGKEGDTSLVAKDGDIVELPRGGEIRTLRLKSPNRDPLEIQVRRGPEGWRVIGLALGDAAAERRSRETLQLLAPGPRSRFDTSPWKDLPARGTTGP